MKLQKNCKKKRLHVARLVSCNIVSNLFFIYLDLDLDYVVNLNEKGEINLDQVYCQDIINYEH